MKKIYYISLLIAALMFTGTYVFAHGGEHFPDELYQLHTQVKELIKQARREQSEEKYAQANKLLQQDLGQHTDLLLQRAWMQQHLHQFDTALKTLNSLPPSPQVSLMKANIFLTRGEARRARSECAALAGKADLLLVSVCMARADSLLGKLQPSFNSLQRIVAGHEGTDNVNLHWAYASLAEMSQQLGQQENAKQYYRQALVSDPYDIASRMRLADILLSEQRFTQVIKLVEDYYDDDALFLRYVRATRAIEHPKAFGYYCFLKGEVNGMKEKNNHLHLDLLAEYDLYLDNEPKQALHWARLHWQEQKTPYDARLLARTATLAGDLNTLEELEAWRVRTGLEDRVLEELLLSTPTERTAKDV